MEQQPGPAAASMPNSLTAQQGATHSQVATQGGDSRRRPSGPSAEHHRCALLPIQDPSDPWRPVVRVCWTACWPLRLAQLGMAVVALGIMSAGEMGIFARFLVPAAVLQCAWSAVAAIVNADMYQQRRTRLLSWTLGAYLALDFLTFLVTFTAASGALGLGYHIAVERCAAEPVRCPVIQRVWPKAVLAWVALQPGSAYFAFVDLWVHGAYTV